MNSITKKLLAGVAAAATLLSGMAFAGGALADDAATEKMFTAEELKATQSITVTASDDTDISDKTLVAIPLAYYSSAQYITNDEGERVITGFDVMNVSESYGEAINEALNSAGIDTSTIADGATDATGAYDSKNPMAWVVQNLLDSTDSPWSGKLRDFLDALKNESVIASAEGKGTWAPTAEGSTNSQTVSGLQPGVYMIVDRTTNGQASIVMMNGTGIDGTTKLQGTKDGADAYTLGDVTYKIHGITVEKKIIKGENNEGKGNGDFIGNGDTSADEGYDNETSIGRKVTFQLETQSPNWTGYDTYYLALNDTLSKGLTFDPNSVKVTLGDTTLTKDVDYQVVTDGANPVDSTQSEETGKEYVGGSSFNVVFGQLTDGAFVQNIAKAAAFPANAAGNEAKIVVTYDAWVNKDAVIGYPGNPNIAEVEYSHNPGKTDDHEKKDAKETRTYVGGFSMIKTDAKNNSLAGAEFQITQTDPITEKVNTLQFVKVDEKHYRLADHTETTGTTDTIVSGAAGVLFIDGLDGTYTVTETKSPFNNPILPEFTIKVRVDKTQAGKYKVEIVKGDINGQVETFADSEYDFTVRNARNLAEMPKTGAVWLCIYMVAGLLCVGGGLTLMRARKR